MRFGSVCSGIEAASRAWIPLGWQCEFVSEIDSSANSVLKWHYPGVPNCGDISGLRNRWMRRLGIGSIDVLMGGTPCQGFSLAGLRGGLGDDRSNLALEFLRCARRLRPSWIVWENVPGVTSCWSDEAANPASQAVLRSVQAAREDCIAAGLDISAEVSLEDFEEVDQTNDLDCFTSGLEELGYGWAYRILDAQYTGVPQRRRRIFLVGYSGKRDGVAGSTSREDIQRFSRISASVLFERHCLSGDPPPIREAGASVADSLEASLGRRNGMPNCGSREGQLISGTLGGGSGNRGWCDDLDRAGAFIPDVAPPLTSNPYGDHESREGFLVPMTAPTLFASNGGVSSGYHPVIPFDTTQITSSVNRSNPQPGDERHPITATGDAPAIVFNPSASGKQTTLGCSEIPGALKTSTPMGLLSNQAVRRLTPIECERLMGLPDEYTLVPHKGKPMADGPRYKMIGNSIAVPCLRWIGERIDFVASCLALNTDQ